MEKNQLHQDGSSSFQYSLFYLVSFIAQSLFLSPLRWTFLAETSRTTRWVSVTRVENFGPDWTTSTSKDQKKVVSSQKYYISRPSISQSKIHKIFWPSKISTTDFQLRIKRCNTSYALEIAYIKASLLPCPPKASKIFLKNWSISFYTTLRSKTWMKKLEPQNQPTDQL